MARQVITVVEAFQLASSARQAADEPVHQREGGQPPNVVLIIAD